MEYKYKEIDTLACFNKAYYYILIGRNQLHIDTNLKLKDQSITSAFYSYS